LIYNSLGSHFILVKFELKLCMSNPRHSYRGHNSPLAIHGQNSPLAIQKALEA